MSKMLTFGKCSRYFLVTNSRARFLTQGATGFMGEPIPSDAAFERASIEDQRRLSGQMSRLEKSTKLEEELPMSACAPHSPQPQSAK